MLNQAWQNGQELEKKNKNKKNFSLILILYLYQQVRMISSRPPHPNLVVLE